MLEKISLLKKRDTIFLLIAICVVSGLVAYIMNVNFVEMPAVNSSQQRFVNLLILVVGILTPLSMVLGYSIFFILVAMFQTVKSKTYKFEIFRIAVISYLPILIGTVLNLILTFLFGYSEIGYITIHTIFEGEILQTILKQLEPFQIFSLVMMATLYMLSFNKGRITVISSISIWLVLSILSESFMV
ncbi:hypothetical protein [Pseudalkalibacillus hwajinpoensis]|uniref:hypothetical protein n=1 Tax=Guptibacillus hwajinpoensis TaxID=208199 RepID=UPI00384C77D4